MLTILVILALIGLVPLTLALQRRWSRLRGIGGGLLVSYITVVLMLAAGEVYFRYVHAAPEGQLARQNWMARYWQTNSLGYRDSEPAPERYAGKQTVLVVGDSFAAGWGVPNVADRFSDVLAAKLGDGYAVFNLGQPGIATASELKNLQAYPVQPNVVVLQYFLNDIEDAALSIGQYQEPPPMPTWARDSYLGNFLFSLGSGGFGPSYWTWEYARYDDFYGAWSAHQAEIKAFVDYVNSIGARLIVVIFPNMQDPAGSIPYVDRVAQAFEAQGVTDILKLFDAVAAWPDPSTLLVSTRDAHPSAAFHHLVGETLYERFFQP